VGFNLCLAHLVVCHCARTLMACSVHLDCQTRFRAIEIHNVPLNTKLTAKLKAAHLMTLQAQPKHLFGASGVVTKFPAAELLGHAVVRKAQGPPLSPLLSPWNTREEGNIECGLECEVFSVITFWRSDFAMRGQNLREF